MTPTSFSLCTLAIGINRLSSEYIVINFIYQDETRGAIYQPIRVASKYLIERYGGH